MRTHDQIIKDAGGYRALAAKLGLPEDRVRFWERRKSIPPGQWAAVSSARIASFTELSTTHGMAKRDVAA